MNITEYIASDKCFEINVFDVMHNYIDIPKGTVKWWEFNKKYKMFLMEQDIAHAIKIMNKEHMWFHLYPRFVMSKKTFRILMLYKTPNDDPKDSNQYSGVYIFDGKNNLGSSYGRCRFYNLICRPFTGLYMDEYC